MKEINLSVVLKENDIKEIMDAACKGGINYWCKSITYKGKDVWRRAGQYVIDNLPLTLEDYDGQTYTLTKENFVAAIEKETVEVYLYSDIRTGKRRIDTEVFSCKIADLIVREAIDIGEFT